MGLSLKDCAGRGPFQSRFRAAFQREKFERREKKSVFTTSRGEPSYWKYDFSL